MAVTQRHVRAAWLWALRSPFPEKCVGCHGPVRKARPYETRDRVPRQVMGDEVLQAALQLRCQEKPLYAYVCGHRPICCRPLSARWGPPRQFSGLLSFGFPIVHISSTVSDSASHNKEPHCPCPGGRWERREGEERDRVRAWEAGWYLQELRASDRLVMLQPGAGQTHCWAAGSALETRLARLR